VLKPHSLLHVAFLTHEPFFPPSGGGSAEAVYLVAEMVRRGYKVHVFCPQVEEPEGVERKFHIRLHQFTKWRMGRYAKFRNFKYLTYPFFLKRMVVEAHRQIKFGLIFSQHAISAVAAGKLKRKLNVPVVMNFPDLLTGFMETWPGHVAPRPLVEALKRFEILLPARYDADGVLAVSDTLAELFASRGYPRRKIHTMYYGYDAEKFPFHAYFPSTPPVVAMHGSFDAHHLGEIAFGAIRRVTKKRPGTIFRFIGKKTGVLENFLTRAQREIPNFKFEATGFVPYPEVAKHLFDANVGIVPYEESAGTHCAFVAKVVEYVASGLPCVCTPLKSIQSYFQNDPMVCFSKFNGADFGDKIVGWLDASWVVWQLDAAKSAARVQAELDWQPLCHKAVDFVEQVFNAEAQSRGDEPLGLRDAPEKIPMPQP
jgi:glycosyltransferase involved in cell wall biosynthesis